MRLAPKQQNQLFCALGLAVTMLFGLNACSSIPTKQRDEVRQQYITSSQETLSVFLAKDPDLQAKIDQAAGYLVGEIDNVMVAVAGKDSGYGVLHDNGLNTNTYLDISTLGLGVGVGSTSSHFLALINSRKTLLEMQKGKWFVHRGIKSAAGDEALDSWAMSGDVELRTLNKTGATVKATVGITRVKVNTNLTDTGVSVLGVPNVDSTEPDSQGDKAPRIWPHRLPLMGQKVIDLGYDLPLPYGAGLVYANVTQDMELTNLAVGFNGQPVQPYDWVAFSNAVTDLNSPQVKLDAWVLPFLNVYAIAGKVSGDIDLDVSLDGDELLQQIGEDCSGIIPSVECLVLEGRNVTFPVRAKVDPETWGLGFVLAGGWHDWFVAIPFNITWSNGKNVDIKGDSITVSPRGGYSFALPDMGRLSLFVGANYLDSKNTAKGMIAVPDTNISFEYVVDQRNTDKWNTVVGFNWDISQFLSVSAEYDGFTGSREAYIGSVTVRF